MLRCKKCLFAKKRSFLERIFVCESVTRENEESEGKNTIKINQVKGFYGSFMNGFSSNPISDWLCQIKLLNCHQSLFNVRHGREFIELCEIKPTNPKKKTFEIL
jgi:hypothetical protein